MSNSATHSLGLRAGELVQVRSKEQILSTLDARGMLEDMPFMPEMLEYCGKTMRVGKRAHKTCDPAVGIIGRRMERTVHLENVRCSGTYHDGCQARCLIFWKEAWLKRVDGTEAALNPPRAAATASAEGPCSEMTLHSGVKTVPAAGESEPTYMCQNTQVKFASHPLKWWDLRQYVEDYTSGNVRLSQLVTALTYSAWRTIAEAGVGIGAPMRWIYDRTLRSVGGTPYPLRPYGVPKGTATPKALLDLKEGELVRVKGHGEILKTLDSNYRNRGLYFDPEMVPFTERQYRVARRVQNIIDEKTGRMIRFRTDAIELENVVCEARYAVCRRFCPRAIVPYWREIWLDRVPDSQNTSVERTAAQRGNSQH